MTTTSSNEHNKANSQFRSSDPFWLERPATVSQRRYFWISSERINKDGKTFQRGAMYLEWQAPELVTQPYPIVLVHGGRLQSTEWIDIPDGRPVGRSASWKPVMPFCCLTVPDTAGL